MVPVSASEHLVVQSPVAASRRRWSGVAAVVTLLMCAGVLAYLLTRPSGGPGQPSIVANSPVAWLHGEASLLHKRLRLDTMVEYAGDTVAVLQISTGGRGRMQVTLHQHGGRWSEVAP
jgi:hypothetical protein